MAPVDSIQILSVAIYYISKQASIQTIIQIMNILSVFGLFVILLKCVAASGDDFGSEFKEAVETGSFEWLWTNWEGWGERRDLLDDVIAKGADALSGLFKVLEMQNSVYLLHFLMEKGDD